MENRNNGNNNSAPDFKALRGMLPSFIKGFRQRKLSGKGVRSAVPRRVCQVCTKLFDLGMRDPEAQLITDVCPDCRGKLKKGMTAVVCDCRHAFVTFKNIAQQDLAGKIVPVEKNTMDEIEKQFKKEQADGN